MIRTLRPRGESLPPEMTDTETVAHLRRWLTEGRRSIWGWPTDPCGYSQHIRFVHWRNDYWDTYEGTFDDFVQEYADKLEAEARDAGGDEMTPACPVCEAGAAHCASLSPDKEYNCTRLLGHGGDHAMLDDERGEIVARWSEEMSCNK